MKLEYKVYKLLKKQEKEEYDYKFTDRTPGIFTYICIKTFFFVYLFILIVFNILLSMLILLKEETKDIDISVMLAPIFDCISTIAYGFFIILLIAMIVDIIGLILYQKKERKWLNKIIYFEDIDNKQIPKRKDQRGLK